MGDITKNFSKREFECNCGCENNNISETLVNLLQNVRDLTGRSIHITSGIRCKDYNDKIGGVKNSAHVPADLGTGEGEVGHAVDVFISNSSNRFELLEAVFPVGFIRLGIGHNFLHLDIDKRKPQNVGFDYYIKDHVG